MFIYNLKINRNKLFKIFVFSIILVVLILFGIATYTIFYQSIKVKDNIENSEISNLSSENYTNILKSVSDHLNDYVGEKIHFTGYVYRGIDFMKDEFVLARDMVIDSSRSNINCWIYV